MTKTGVAILGSTGSIGRQTLDVIADHPDRFQVVTLAAGNNLTLLEEQAARFKPSLLVARSDRDLADIRTLPTPAGLVEAATHPDVDIVVVATSGHDAIHATYDAILAGKTIALANKETIICAAEIIMPLAKAQGVEIRPVDSEHSAIWQSLGGAPLDSIRRLMITASGGPFRNSSLEEMASVTVEQALAHPRWHMGAKITIDSATLVNKGLEVIEAHWLFNVPFDSIDVVIHPESIIHSLVEFNDRSTIAQFSPPDMRLPIQFALTYPDHIDSQRQPLDLAQLGSLSFAEPDRERFPALRICEEVGRKGQTYRTVLSAVDEVAVGAFIEGRIGFLDIAALIQAVLDVHLPAPVESIAQITEVDHWSRAQASSLIDQKF